MAIAEQSSLRCHGGASAPAPVRSPALSPPRAFDLGHAAAVAKLAAASAQATRFAVVGTLPPKRCGIANFTADVRASLLAARPRARCLSVAIVDGPDDTPPGGHDAETIVIRRDDLDDHRRAAERLNAAGVEVVNIQHEFGIFGGVAGDHVLTLVAALKCPVIVTLHTVLQDPDPDQRRVTQALLRMAAGVIVMADKGARLLMDVHGASADRLVICPHGTPDRPYVDPETVKPRFGWQGRRVLMTFGLLSPGKGLETMIEALPRIVGPAPDALYVIVGATHPELRRREGEAYRRSLIARAARLGVEEHVRFVDEYLEVEPLLDHLSACDVYVTPYLNPVQITSGTLAYAIALGKPVISTPYWHAAEAVRSNMGHLVPFADAEAMARAALALLTDPARLETCSRNAYAVGRGMIWSQSAKRYLAAFDDARHQAASGPRRRPARITGRPPNAEPTLEPVARMSDDCGMLQHGAFTVMDRHHGYCVDDNARALILTQRLRALGRGGRELDRWEGVYAAFLNHAWSASAGAFRNFMGYDRRWLEEAGSHDSNARCLWALGEVAAANPGLRDWALSLSRAARPTVTAMRSLRAMAFRILGAVRLLGLARADGGEAGDARAMLERDAEDLHAFFRAHARPGWHWFEPRLTYDNARLPQALIEAGRALDKDEMIADGLTALAWLCAVQKHPSGVFCPVGSDFREEPFARPATFDQQPLEAWATVDACIAARALDPGGRWLDEAHLAHVWFFGENVLGLPLADERGGCHDGLTPNGLNRNQGAESALALQLANAAMARLATSRAWSGPSSPIVERPANRRGHVA
jgi:glycosyltransferase involved in cell wall biosynthesis